MRPEKAAWELKNERNKVNVRWLLMLLIAGYLYYLLETGQGQEIGSNHLFSGGYIAGVAGLLAVANVLFMAFLWGVGRGRLVMRPFLKYVSMLVDFIVISLVLLPTGGDHSIFFVVYFIVIISNSLRYGMRLALSGVFAFNLCYVAVLVYQYYPDLVIPNVQGEVLKVAVFWVVGLYTGYIARRFQILQGEVEKYQDLVRRLMARDQES
jgi:signal transduction histidine kinase